MCPSAPVSLPLNIDTSSTDEEVILFLGGRRVGDSIPLNVITEVNPFSIEPRHSPEGIWFLYNSEDSQSHNEGSIIKATKYGYWRSIDDLRIFTRTPTVGRKTTREFYGGQAPFGDRTGWMMHEYQVEQMAAQGNDKAPDYSSLCRFFLQNEQRSNNGEQCDPVSPDDVDEYLESMLPSLREQERNSCVGDAANRSQVVGESEQRKPESSGRPPQDLVNDNPTEDIQAPYDFSREDYMELKDLYSLGSSSSGSDNSSLMSLNSDEFFDAEALLRDIENESVLNMEEGRVDYRFSVAPSVRLNQVLIRPPLPGASHSNDSNLVVMDSGSANPIPASNPALCSSTVELRSYGDASTSCSSQGSQEDSGSSQGGRTPRGPGSKSVSRISKLGKRYCCFGSF